MPDFRAAERTFQLLTQVSGRAGRGAEPGRVIVQTYNPGAPAISCAAGHDYARFSEVELANRASLGYPPYARLMAVRIEGTERGAERSAAAIAEAARRVLTPTGGVSMLGPAPAPLEKLRGRSRWQVLFRAPDASRLRRVHAALAAVARQPPGGADIRFDMDPQSML
jgi:primosomal protein N' (replication factor Y)